MISPEKWTANGTAFHKWCAPQTSCRVPRPNHVLSEAKGPPHAHDEIVSKLVNGATMCTMGRLGWVSLGIMLVLGAGTPSARGSASPQEGPASRPTYEVEPTKCVTANCHADVKAYAVLHGPVAANTCDACHQPTGAKAHTFELRRQKAELCTYCHEFSTGAMPVVHEPVRTGECLGCHNPHGGANKQMVRETSTAQLCGRCHESVALGKRFLHHPVQTGECEACHRPHAARYPKLLDATGTDLCLSCHTDFAARMTQVRFTHKALEEGCTKCHDVHGSAYPMEVTQALPDLCLNCHETIRESTKAAYQHPAALGQRACLTCHTAHGGDLARLMCDLPVRVCMNCHDREIRMKAGGIVAAVAEVNEPGMFKHAPIRDGQCGGCHSTHGGGQPLLLRRTYTTEFYQRFSAEKYDLCFGCHDEQLAEREPAQGLTNFRNGEHNLHFVHVAKGDRGRSCYACHSTHATKYEQLIRDWVPYGEWRLPIRFQKTPTGGMCVTGCHPAFSYDRETPVAARAIAADGRPAGTSDSQVSGGPGTLQTSSLGFPTPDSAPGGPLPLGRSPEPPSGVGAGPRVPAADPRKPVIVNWSGRDVNGAEIDVPAGGRPSVLLFLRADQVQSQQVVKMVAAATPQIGLAQVVVVFTGPQAEEHARAFAAAGITSGPVLADAAYVLSKLLGVAVWPATLVVQANGVVVAHLGGAPLSLTVELQAYLDLATKRIDRAELGRRLAQRELLADGPATRAAWHWQMGRKLREEGKAEEARTMLADGLEFQPNSPELWAEMARTLADLKQAEQTMDLLKVLPAGAMPGWEQNLLRGRMSAVLGQWDQAKRLATAVLQERPDLDEAHYLMGRIYEQDRDWQKAAQEYRAAHKASGP